MTWVITRLCRDCVDQSCVEVCPDLAGWTVDVEAQGIAATDEPSIARWKADR